jgi:alanyl-tRNA synthetase
MGSDEIREKYLKFFESREHIRIEPAPLVLESDPTTLFTSAGMQPLTPYLKGEPHPKGKRLVDIQPSLRLQDIEEVGDKSHSTFFEMLGNWSLGDYFKKEQLAWCLEFFTKELGLPKEKLWVSVFEGTAEVPKDTESAEIWKSLGIPDARIHFYGVDKNWWSRSGTPQSMPVGEIGGPDSEVFYEFSDVAHDKKYGNTCHPNCPCGRFMEIGNSVFIQYEKDKDGKLTELPQKNVDFGGGLERTTAAASGFSDVFLTDVYEPIIKALEKNTKMEYASSQENTTNFRIIADHLRAAVAIASEGVAPSNKLQGYVLRRLIRRAAIKVRKLSPDEGIIKLGKNVANSITKDARMGDVIAEEMGKFEAVLNKGTQLVSKDSKIKPFDLYQTYGLPFEVTKEIYEGLGRELGEVDKEEFDTELKKHQERSRTSSAGMFKGGLADTSEAVTKLHTATHLLHAALRKVFGEHVSQKGSNITTERLRFDFSHPEKLTDEQIKEVEKLVNDVVDEDLPVSYKLMSLGEAEKEGALHFFGERYGKEVKVYTIGEPDKEWISKEVCGGPHVAHTGEVGRVRIIKQEKVGSGILRIYATNKPE